MIIEKAHHLIAEVMRFFYSQNLASGKSFSRVQDAKAAKNDRRAAL